METINNLLFQATHLAYTYTNTPWAFVVVGLSIWFIALFIPLSKYDLRDLIATLIYVGFFMFFGVVAVIAVPIEHRLINTSNGIVVTLAGLGTVAYLRWMYGKFRMTTKEKQLKEGNIDGKAKG